MSVNKTLSHTNFSGIKYSNNPLTVDPNSFSNANNVYLNKYNALISRPPITSIDYPADAYGAGLNNLIPIYLKIVALYNLSNGGEVYVILDTDDNVYSLRYKNASGTYSNVVDYGESISTITDFTKFSIVQYKQFYIAFTVDGAMVLDTSDVDEWVSLSTKVDIPITVIQTGNERLEIEGNDLTKSYKKQFIIKADSDDTIYNLPVGETATVVFANQTDTTYEMTNADKYSRQRLLRKLNNPVNSEDNVIISMVGEKIAIAHTDRVDISLDYGETFETIVYPTIASINYKNTASISDAGDAFFYVHTDGVYRYMLGTQEWTLIKVVLTPTYDNSLNDTYDGGYSVVNPITGLLIESGDIGANYCHFVNAEKFAFMLAHYTGTTWIATVYTKGLNITNLFDQELAPDTIAVNSFAYNLSTPISIIGANTTKWAANPYSNNRKVRILNNDTLVCYYDAITSKTKTRIFLKAALNYLNRTIGSINYYTPINYVYAVAATHTEIYEFEINEIALSNTNTLTLLIKQLATVNSGDLDMFIRNYTILFENVSNTVAVPNRYDNTLTLTEGAITSFNNGIAAELGNENLVIYKLAENEFLGNTKLVISTSDDNLLEASYTLPFTFSTKMITAGPYYIVYNEANSSWYTNLPLLTTLTYTYLDDDDTFIQVPTASFDDQNLWLAMGKTLWIGNLVDDKLSVSAINQNSFSKQITGIIPISAASKAIFFTDSIILCEEAALSDGSTVWYYYPLKFTIGIRRGDTVITTNDGKLTIFPTKFGLAVLTYQLDIAATEQAITYITDDVKTLWSEFYKASTKIKILHHNTQLILSNGTNQVLIYDFRTNGWYPQTLPTKVKVSRIQGSADNYEILELQPEDIALTTLTGLYQMNKEADELYTYAIPYKDFGTTVISWHLTSQLLLLAAPNNYKNISQLIIDQVDSDIDKQSAYLTTQLFRQRANIVKPSLELIYNIDTFAKIVKKVNWWKVLALKWQLQNDAGSSYPTQLRLYNLSIIYDVSYEVK